ncbi:MAG: hypothetical protein R6W78_12315, partial [Bacteroidales bacterium]
MKTRIFIAAITGAVLTSCSSSFRATSEYDDVYYTPSSEPVVVAERVATPVYEKPVSNYERYVTQLNDQGTSAEYVQGPDTMLYQDEQLASDKDYPGTEYYEEDGNSYAINNNYYNDDDYFYASRIRRFHRPFYTYSYYDPWYNDPYWYDYNPIHWSLGYSWGYSPSWNFGFSYGYPYYYSSWYSPYSYYGYNDYYGYSPYRYSYWTGYRHGYYNGYYGNYYGYNYGRNDSWSNSRVYYGPRQGSSTGRAYGSSNSVNAANLKSTNVSSAYGRRTASSTAPYNNAESGRRVATNTKSTASDRNVSTRDNVDRRTATTSRESSSNYTRSATGNRNYTSTYTRPAAAQRPAYTRPSGNTRTATQSRTTSSYKEIIEPIGYRAKEHNETFFLEKSRVVNRFTKQFLENYCNDLGDINWNKLVEFNSGNFD